MIKISQAYKNYLLPMLSYFKAIYLIIVRCIGYSLFLQRTDGNANSYGVTRLPYGPSEHGQVLFFTRRRQINETGHGIEHGNIEIPQMSNIIHAVYGRTIYEDDGTIAIDT